MRNIRRDTPPGLVLFLSAVLVVLVSSAALAIGTADVEVTKSNDTGGTAVAGQVVTYTITLHNYGPNGATQIHLEDLFDSHLINVVAHATVPDDCTMNGQTMECDIQGIGKDGDDTITVTAQVDPATPADTVITNCATITNANQEDPNSDNNTGCDEDGFIVTHPDNTPTALEMDREPCANASSPFCTGDLGALPTVSDVDRIFEAGETMRMDPTWKNNVNAPLAITGTLSNFTGPGDGAGHAVYFDPAVVGDNGADYGTVPALGASDCHTATGNCYALRLELDDPANRPARHWDTTVLETLSTGESKTWQLHIGLSFEDVPNGDMFYRSIETIFHNQITVGCADGSLFCPFEFTSRGQMAAFIVRSIEGTDAAIPTAIVSEYDCTQSEAQGGFSQFVDVAAGPLGTGNDFCRHINYLKHLNLTAGCFDASHFCPGDPVTRGAMAVLVAGGMEVHLGNTADPGGSVPLWGQNAGDNAIQYNCTDQDQIDPVTTNTIPAMTAPFLDVNWNSPFCKFVGFLKVNKVVVGDGAGHYLPDDNIKRSETAAILSGAFVELPLYGPAIF